MPSMHNALASILAPCKPGLMTYNRNPISQGDEQEAHEFEAILDYTVGSKAA